MIDKVSLLKGNVAVDERGSVSFVNDFNFDNVKRFYQVKNHTLNFIRAWHGHKKEGKYVYVPKGSALIGVVNLETEEITKKILSSKTPSILWIPPNHANGFMNLEKDTIIQFFSTSFLKDSLNDDIRFPWNKWDIWNIEQR